MISIDVDLVFWLNGLTNASKVINDLLLELRDKDMRMEVQLDKKRNYGEI